MGENYKLVVFVLDEKKFSLHLENMERVIQAVEITPLLKAPDFILGIINIRGDVVPIINIRKKFNLPAKPVSIDHKIIIVKTPAKKFGFVVDDIDGYVESPVYAVIKGESVWPGLEYVDEVVKVSDELILINNPETFFLPSEVEKFNKIISEK